ncbi:MAG: hypothetical protein Q7T07_07710, partial [Burkholderiaceae bacterium]|nr:hypothetical protein [Burkholderiaceae bacterium]
MKPLNKQSAAELCRLFIIGLSLLAPCACSALRPSTTPLPAFYALDIPPVVAPAATSAAAPTLRINPPHAVAGFDSPRIIYLRESHKLEYFAHSEW